MPRVICVKGVSFGATGEVFVEGQTYEISDDFLEASAEYFKKSAGRPSNKMAATDEDKSAGGDEAAEVTEEATEVAE